MANVFYLALKIGYILSKHTQKNSLSQFCLTITKPFSPFYLTETTNYWSLSVSRTVSQLIMHKFTLIDISSQLQ